MRFDEIFNLTAGGVYFNFCDMWCFAWICCGQEYRLKDARGGGTRKTDVRTFTKDESSHWRIRAAEEEVRPLIRIMFPSSHSVSD